LDEMLNETQIERDKDGDGEEIKALHGKVIKFTW